MKCKDKVAARNFMLKAATADQKMKREVLSHIYSDGTNLVATNGRILVYAQHETAKGFYDFCTVNSGGHKTTRLIPVTDADNLVYPNYKVVIPDLSKAVKTINFNTADEFVEKEIFKLQFTIATSGEDGALIAQSHLDLLLQTGLIYKVYILKGIAPIFFEATGVFNCIVMPRRACHNNETKDILREYQSTCIVAWAERHKHSTAKTAHITESTFATETGFSPEESKPSTTAKPHKQSKPSFAYICELDNGKTVTLYSMQEVERRNDIKKCHIEPIKKGRRIA